MGYTKGEWNVEREYNVTAGRRVIATCGGYSDNLHQEEAHQENIANAHLIAACPCMFEALKRLVKETRPYAYQGMLDEAEKALKKAEGK